MATLTSSRGVRQSPFRETEWDRKLDGLLDDLEHSSAAVAAVEHHQPRRQQQQHQQLVSSGLQRQTNNSSTSSTSASFQQQQQSFSSSSSSQHLRSQSASSAARSGAVTSSGGGGYSLAKSASSNSLHDSADTMLKDLEGSLKASSNYIESHRTVSGPNGTREFHEYRSYASDGGGSNGAAPGATDFNLERQVQHMMPPGSLNQDRFNNSSTSSTTTTNHGLQSANMVSSMQQQKQSYTTYKVQTNQYGSTGERIAQDNGAPDGERPGSRLKQNIDELDTLLYDLNNARKMSDAGADYTASSITPGNMSSDDYSFNEGHQGHVKKTTTTYNDYNYQGGDYSSKKPPSPSPRRRQPGQPLSSPSTVRKLSPGPSSSSPRRPGPGEPGYMTTTTYNYTSSTTRDNTTNGGYTPSYPHPPSNNNLPAPTTTYPSYSSPTPPPTCNTPSTHTYPPRDSSPAAPLNPDGTPTGVSYYTKYHSSHAHSSQGTGPVAFPANSTPRLGRPNQTPPKRVDDLMTELSEFDSSIQHTGFVEPMEPRPAHREPTPEDYRPYRDPSPVKQPKQPSTPGPAVYYPPGEMFSNTKSRHDTFQSQGTPGGPGPVVVTHTTTLEGSGGKGKAKGKYKAKEKSRYAESSSEGGKQGAAVIPICLPFGCAAPCTIM